MATDDKYDRQLRLWGPEGQKRLAESHVLLIKANPIGTEALKNLILPGIGNFTVADDALVTPSDHGNNFFVTVESIGKPRAEVTAVLLGELNPDSRPHALHGVTVETFIKNPSKLIPYTLIIGCDLSEEEIIALGNTCAAQNKPLILTSCFGLIGYVRLYSSEHDIIDSKPIEQVVSDLRLSRPFPELLAFAKNFDLAKMNDLHHKHTPFPVILIKAKELWKEKNEGKLPGDFKEKSEFTKMIKEMSRDFHTEENFQEAAAAAPQCFVSNELKGPLKSVLEDPKCEDKTIKDKFWLLATTLKRFYMKYSELPLNGKIPDITADTENYLTLQKIYKDKANEDFLLFLELLKELKKERALPEGIITESEARNFCENNGTVMCIRYSQVSEEYTKGPNKKTIEGEINDSESLIQWYILVRASLRYHKKYKMYPAEKAPHDQV